MNPLLWERRHQIALVVAAAIGAALGAVLGYIVYGSARGADGGVSFGYWIGEFRYGGLWWAVFGAIAAGGAVYVLRLISD